MSGLKNFAAALAVLAGEINRRQDELDELRRDYERLGGTYEDGPDEPPPKRRQGPRPAASGAAEPDDFGVTIDGSFVRLGERQALVAEMLVQALPGAVKIDDLAAPCGGSKQTLYNDIYVINKKLAAAGRIIRSLKGLGYRMETLS